jgi:catechol 2,3-dioxygenase-like lactoylglutathione lyase family enzyme
MSGEKPTARAETVAIWPFFIVGDVSRALAFYCGVLGFEVGFQQPRSNPFFALIQRDGAHLFFKSVGDGVQAAPNQTRHPDARWDAYVYTPDPDALAAEFAAAGAAFSTPLGDNSDNLRGFEVTDPDGYVLFFGRPN